MKSASKNWSALFPLLIHDIFDNQLLGISFQWLLAPKQPVVCEVTVCVCSKHFQPFNVVFHVMFQLLISKDIDHVL